MEQGTTRNTKQKRAVYAALCALGHPSATEVYDYVKTRDPKISRGTVFRVLRAFSEGGRAVKIHIAGSDDRLRRLPEQGKLIKEQRARPRKFRGRVFVYKIPIQHLVVRGRNGHYKIKKFLFFLKNLSYNYITQLTDCHKNYILMILQILN